MLFRDRTPKGGICCCLQRHTTEHYYTHFFLRTRPKSAGSTLRENNSNKRTNEYADPASSGGRVNVHGDSIEMSEIPGRDKRSQRPNNDIFLLIPLPHVVFIAARSYAARSKPVAGSRSRIWTRPRTQGFRQRCEGANRFDPDPTVVQSSDTF